MPIFSYRGNPDLIEALESRLEESGFEREGEVELADFVITFCTNLTELEDLYFGEDGIVDKMKPGACAIDLSASTPDLSNEMHAIVTLSELGMVHAPLMVKNQVSPEAFEKSNLSCFLAGDQTWIDACNSILECIFASLEKLSDPKIAQLAKASNTLQKVSETIAVIESHCLLESSKGSISSLDLNGFTLSATSPEAYFVLQAITERRYESPFTVEMLMGELSAAIMAADDNDIIIPQAEAAFHLLELLAMIGGARKSPAALALVYGNIDEEECKENGLDWSRAQSLYGQDDLTGCDHDHNVDFDPNEGFNDPFYGDDVYEDDITGFGYCTN